MRMESAARRGWSVLAAVITMAALATAASATTLVRASLDDLLSANRTVVVAEAVDAVSYWNRDHTFILTDVTVRPIETLKGEVAQELTVTLMGGSVDDLTTLILGGAELIPGRSYVLFLNEEELPGALAATTVRDLSQGAFAIHQTKDGRLRAVSQANSLSLLADSQGNVLAPGGEEGFALESMVQELRERVERIERDKGVTP